MNNKVIAAAVEEFRNNHIDDWIRVGIGRVAHNVLWSRALQALSRAQWLGSVTDSDLLTLSPAALVDLCTGESVQVRSILKPRSLQNIRSVWALLKNNEDFIAGKQHASLINICGFLRVLPFFVIRYGLRKHIIRVNTDKKRTYVPGNKINLLSALINVINNAIEAKFDLLYRQNIDAIDFSEGQNGLFVTVQTFEQGAHVIVKVSDTSGGIPETLLEPGNYEYRGKRYPRIFDYGASTGAGGIGLTEALFTVLMHDGDIEITNDPGRGAAFVMTFPQAAAKTPG